MFEIPARRGERNEERGGKFIASIFRSLLCGYDLDKLTKRRKSIDFDGLYARSKL